MSTSIAIGAGIGIGAAGVGAGVAVTVLTKDTRAWIGNATVDATGSSARVDTYDGSLSDTGVFGITDAADDVHGVIVVATSDENVLSIGDRRRRRPRRGHRRRRDRRGHRLRHPRVHRRRRARSTPTRRHRIANQDVRVVAVNDVTVLAIAGAVGVGIVGLAGGVDVGVLHNDTTAFIAGADVRARRHVHASARWPTATSSSFAISAGGGVVGLGAAVSVWTLGGNLVSTYPYADKKSQRRRHHGRRRLARGQGRERRHHVHARQGRPADRRRRRVIGAGRRRRPRRRRRIDARTPATAAVPRQTPRPRSTRAPRRRRRRLDRRTRQPPSSSARRPCRAAPRAFIGRNATVTAGGDVRLNARSRIDVHDGRRRPRHRRARDRRRHRDR